LLPCKENIQPAIQIVVIKASQLVSCCKERCNYTQHKNIQNNKNATSCFSMLNVVKLSIVMLSVAAS